MYCTGADLLELVPEATLIQLTNETVEFDAPPPVNIMVVGSCIRYADELIDAHLRGRYTLPLAEIPTVLRDIAVTLTRYRLYARRPEGSIPDLVKDDCKTALKQLEQIRDAKLTLGLQSTGTDAPERGEFRVRGRQPTFGGRNGVLDKF
ncbi:DUF1320 domain-containing protein [Prodigiosinella aquatilis]|nr:DUF1320 domain-containing protein [Prodigiosinella sp. LS101]WJV52755.1 DUF1320 domain-containing protein [Prodigiosinella sp. LS101]WJV57109.1 DUF1320 domain-containing protein [Pectobacteriaceae bacterium C111]